MICHAPQAAAFPVLALPVAVIELCFLASPVALIGAPPLFPPRFLPAAVSAVALPPVAGIADVEHQSAVRPAASQPPQHHLFGHRTPTRVWTTALCRGTPACLWLCPRTGAAMKKPRPLQRSGFPLSTWVFCLAGASSSRSLEEDSGSRYRRSSEKLWVPVNAYTESIFFMPTRSTLRAVNRKCLPELVGLRVNDGELYT